MLTTERRNQRLRNICELSQINNLGLVSVKVSVTVRPDAISSDESTFAKYKDDVRRRKRFIDVVNFASYVSISDVRSQSTEL